MQDQEKVVVSRSEIASMLDRMRQYDEALRTADAALRAAARSRPILGEVKEKWPAGHYYSPIPNLAEVRADAARIFDRSRSTLPGIDLRVDAQLAHLPEMARLYGEHPFSDTPADGVRYGFDNDMFGAGDALALYYFVRHLRPKRYLEIGSGWSSAVVLDVNDRFLDYPLECTFIEPYPDRLHRLLTPEDEKSTVVIERGVQEVSPEVFDQLEPGDLLFIDSSHVSRIGSDVNYLLLDVIPSLPPGVWVHVHDVFWPFEYPEKWVYDGRAWNEDYLLRALLIGNSSLRIEWFTAFMQVHHSDAVMAAMPAWRGGGSLYLSTLA